MSIADPYLWPEDFLDAHKRHWEDAESLFQIGRLANADHLYGLSAECGLKYLLIFRGENLTPRERVHIDRLWLRFHDLAEDRRWPNVSADNPFADWRIGQRYAHRRHFDPIAVDRHRRGTLQVRTLLLNAILGGSL
ncbi:MAG: SAM-dependent methyltransferase [Anaerolineae bacterium]|nr:SAM-dependent methyltransferase [Anaerolineae bacterium]